MTNPGVCIDEIQDRIRLDGRDVHQNQAHVYVLLNKPAGYLVTTSDPQGRRTIYDLIRDVPGRVFSIGRLDQDTEGVLLLTDDGNLAHRLMHPKHEVIKGYQVVVAGKVDSDILSRLVQGISLEDGMARARTAKLITRSPDHSVLFLELITGKKRQVKRMCMAIGHRVIRLRRLSFAGLTVGDLAIGKWRHLTPSEVAQLKSFPDPSDVPKDAG